MIIVTKLALCQRHIITKIRHIIVSTSYYYFEIYKKEGQKVHEIFWFLLHLQTYIISNFEFVIFKVKEKQRQIGYI